MSSETLYRVGLFITDVSEEHIASIFRVRLLNLPSLQRGYASRRTAKRVSYTVSPQARFKSLVTLKMEAICSSETSVITRATRYKVPEDIYHWYRRRLLVTVNDPSSPIPVTLMMEALSSSETSFLSRATRRNILLGQVSLLSLLVESTWNEWILRCWCLKLFTSFRNSLHTSIYGYYAVVILCTISSSNHSFWNWSHGSEGSAIGGITPCYPPPPPPTNVDCAVCICRKILRSTD
jgi:hypothetical protein